MAPKGKKGRKMNKPNNGTSRAPRPSQDEDVSQALAAQLQEQYRQEFLSNQNQKEGQKRATAPPASAMGDVDVTLQHVDVTLQHVRTNETAPDDSASESDAMRASQREQELADAELARRLASGYDDFDRSSPPPVAVMPTTNMHATSLIDSRRQQELKDADLARRMANDAIMASYEGSSAMHTTATVDSSAAFDEDARLARQLQDEEVARRYARSQIERSQVAPATGVVLTDEEIARRYQNQEQNRASRELTREMLVEDQKRRRRRCCFGWLTFFACVGILIGALYFFGIIDGDTISNISDWGRDDIIDIDPFAPTDDSIPSFNASDPGDQAAYYRWGNDGEGLEIEIVSLLDEDWQQFFEIAVRDWDGGNPDALTISTSRRSYEYECEGERGIIKVCNGNYGDTKWRGINVVLLDRRRNLILESSAKLNEYYLNRATDGQKQYTMCHEIGHGFGLPHWDEDFYNADLGNCMDYTNRPERNKRPDESNFRFLAGLYGEVPGTAVEAQDGGNRALLLRRAAPKDVVTDKVRARYLEAKKELESNPENLHELARWRRLVGNEYAETHEVELGDDLVMVVHMLRVLEE